MDSTDDDEKIVHAAFDNLLSTLDLRYHGYDLTACRKYMNKILSNSNDITNRKLRSLLINKFGDNIAFTNPHDSSKPQMFYSVGIDISRVAETVRNKDPLKVCPELLSTELRQYDFGLDSAYCDANDIQISFDRYIQRRPERWSLFFQ